mgnify:CR=1 FL=1
MIGFTVLLFSGNLWNSSNGVNWIKIGDAPRYGKYIDKTEEKITQSGAEHSVMVYPNFI